MRNFVLQASARSGGYLSRGGPRSFCVSAPGGRPPLFVHLCPVFGACGRFPHIELIDDEFQIWNMHVSTVETWVRKCAPARASGGARWTARC
eukprot:5240684-Pleurochrysis_carterae.AAC.1